METYENFMMVTSFYVSLTYSLSLSNSMQINLECYLSAAWAKTGGIL